MSKVRNPYIDVYKYYLAACVVLSHTRALAPFFPKLDYWLFHGLWKTGIPSFLFISGYYFSINEKEGYQKLWLKKLFKIYSIWTIVYLPTLYLIPNLEKGIGFWIDYFFFGFYHLWYIISLIVGVFLLSFVRKMRPLFIFLTSSLVFLLGLWIQYLSQDSLGSRFIFLSTMDTHNLYRNGLFYSFPVFAMGYAVHRGRFFAKFSKKMIAFLVFISLALNFLEFWQLEISGIHQSYYTDLFLTGPIFTIFFIGLCIKLGKKSPVKWSKSLADQAIVLHVSHAIFIFLIRYSVISKFLPSNFYGLLSLLFAMLFSFIIYSNKKLHRALF